MPSHGGQQVDDDDPYAPRSASEYYALSSSSSSSPSSSSSSAASSSSSSRGTSTPGTTPSSSGSARRTERERSPLQEAPLFGGEPFRESHRTRGPPPTPGSRGQPRSRPLDDYDDADPLRFASGDGQDASGRAGREAEVDDEAEGQTDGFYALLNVQRDATDDEIRDAYRALAVVLHPDKHTTPELKTAADARFRAVQRAYEVLSDPERRSVYDHFGEAGLAHSWSVVAPNRRGGPRSAQEMRDEWERAAREKRDEDLENLVRSKGEFAVNVDANSLFCAASRVPRGENVMRFVRMEVERMRSEGLLPEDGKVSIPIPPVSWSERMSRVGVTQLVGKHGCETPITSHSRASLQGQMVSRNGTGGGNLIGTVKTQWNHRFSTEISTTMMKPRIFVVKGQYEITEFSFLTFVATAATPAAPPALNLTFAQRLSAKSATTGFTTLKSGSYTIGPWGKGLSSGLRVETPTIGVGVTSQGGDGKGWTLTTLVGADNVGLSADYSMRPAILGAAKVRLGATVGTGVGVSAYTNLERRVTENVRLGMGLSCGIPSGGVTLRLKANRLGQRVTVPIQLAPEFRSDLAVACAILPLVSLTALEHLYLRPAKKRRIADKLAKLRKDNVELIEERKRAALEARMVLSQGARKKAEAERRRGGLVILEAYYGKKDRVPGRAEGSTDEAELFRLAWPPSQQQGEEGVSALELEEHEQEADVAWWDVKTPLMTLVSRGQLVIPGGRSKSKLLGFFDPCMGERKHLVVRYLFRGRLHEAVVDDVTQLACPLRAHQL